ncbi:toxin-antitoxin system HicB family antitoxin [Streptomyces sp. KLOTTS4A1]|uniref:toxin-antitoxin system HicB family antitoxin n=1 Tax=Streptomyces sp. KLOTTS4A1 TaxID=3390996 RepID=UPI0039F63026
MNLTPYVDTLRQELATAAEVAGPEARGLAERLTWPLESAARLALLSALSDAMAEVTRELAPGSVGVRLRGTDPEFVVTTPERYEPHQPHQPRTERRTAPVTSPAGPGATTPDTYATGADTGTDADTGTGADTPTARINLRLPAHLKTQAEAAAAREGLSLNAWLGRSVAAALTASGTAPPPRDFKGWTTA